MPRAAMVPRVMKGANGTDHLIRIVCSAGSRPEQRWRCAAPSLVLGHPDHLEVAGPVLHDRLRKVVAPLQVDQTLRLRVLSCTKLGEEPKESGRLHYGKWQGLRGGHGSV